MAVDDPRVDTLMGMMCTHPGRAERVANRLALWYWAKSESGWYGWVGDRFDSMQCWLAHRRGRRFAHRR